MLLPQGLDSSRQGFDTSKMQNPFIIGGVESVARGRSGHMKNTSVAWFVSVYMFPKKGVPPNHEF